MKFYLAALLGAVAFADDTVTERTEAEQSWYDSFSSEVTDDLVTMACLCYDDLSTWDLRPMSFPDDSGYYTVYEGDSNTWTYQEVYFNPCHYLNFSAVFPEDDGLSNLIGDITHGTFAAQYDIWTAKYTALTKEAQWKADETSAIYPVTVNDDGEAVVDTYDDVLGLTVLYNSDEVCVAATEEVGAEMFGFELNVVCDEAVVDEDDSSAFVKAEYASSDLSACVKKVTLNHNAGCPVYSALGFVNFLNNNVWLSGTLLLVFGLTIGLLGQRWFLPICGTFGAMVAFVAFMVFASLF
jgi:hypothetical protein